MILIETLLEQRPLETRHVLSEKHCRLTIVPQTAVDTPEVVLCQHGEAHISQDSRNGQGTLAKHTGLVRFTGTLKIGEQIDTDPSQSVLVAEGLRETCRFL